MKIKRETYSEYGIKTQSVIIEGTTLKKLAEKYKTEKGVVIEPNGNIILKRDGFNIFYSKK